MSQGFIPNSTQVPNVILDHWMAALSGAEFKVLLYVARRTYGFRKDSDNISLTQLASGIRRKSGEVLDRGTGLSRTGVKDACNSLIEKGLLIRSENIAPDGRMNEESTYRLNLFASLPDSPEGVGRKSARVGRKTAYPEVGRISAGGRPENGPGVGRKSAPQKKEQNTEQNTAAAEEAGAVAELASLLVGKGVGHAVAVRLATEKPDECRKYLDWLPHAEVKTTEGAWLVSAIRDGYGPPKAIAKRQAEAVRAAKAATAHREGPHSPHAERGDAEASRLMVSYARLCKTRPDAIAAFESFFSSERDKATKYAASLSEKGRIEFERNAATEEFRLAIFERWVRGEGKGYLAANPERVEASAGHEGENPVVTIAA